MPRFVGYGLAFFLLVVGAILAYAVKPSTAGGVDVHQVGFIMLIAGVIALIVAAINNYMVTHRSVERNTAVTDSTGRVAEHNERIETR